MDPGQETERAPHDDPLPSTASLAERARRGDRGALGQLFEREYAHVHRAVRARLGRALRAHIETGDLVQQTFASALRAFDRGELPRASDERTLTRWLTRCAERRIRDEVDRQRARRRDMRRETPLDHDTALRPEAAAPDPRAPPLDAIIRAEEQAAVGECLRRLPAKYRELIVLREYRGAPWREVAELTGRPSESAAREMHRRALRELVVLLHLRRPANG